MKRPTYTPLRTGFRLKRKIECFSEYRAHFIISLEKSKISRTNSWKKNFAEWASSASCNWFPIFTKFKISVNMEKYIKISFLKYWKHSISCRSSFLFFLKTLQFEIFWREYFLKNRKILWKTRRFCD